MQTTYDESTGNLTIVIPVKGVEGTLSASGKSKVIASTRGNQKIDCGADGEILLGLNAYRKS